MKARRQLLVTVAALLIVGCVEEPRPAPSADRFPDRADLEECAIGLGVGGVEVQRDVLPVVVQPVVVVRLVVA